MLFQAQNSALARRNLAPQTINNILYISYWYRSGPSITRSGQVKTELQRFLGIFPDPTGSRHAASETRLF